MASLILLSNERGDVALEEADTSSEQDQANDECCKRTIGVCDDLGDCGNDDQDVPNGGNEDGDVDRLQATPFLISKVSTCT